MAEPFKSYPLGYSEAEAHRLAMQADFLRDLTEDVLRRAGVAAGMSVLDVGCGVGDASLMVRRLVGADGAVLGIDRAASSVDIAQRRAAAIEAANVRFETADLASFEPAGRFDAVVGRFVLLYMPDPVATLRRVRGWVHPGGVIAFQEVDMSQAAQAPPSNLFDSVVALILATFGAAGVERDMGTKLLSAFRQADLPWPHMIAAARAEAGPQSPIFEWITRALASLLPMAERAGLDRPDDIDIDTLAERLRADAVANQRLTYTPRLVGAWTRVPID